MKFAKIVLLINGIVDVIIGLTLLFIPNIIAQLLGYPVLPGQAFYFAGGWGIAAISFGVARIWASFVDAYVWYNVYLGILEGSILTLFSILCPIIYTDVSYIQIILSLIVGSSFMVTYIIALILRKIKKNNEE